MDKALVSAATGALGPVIGKLAELLEKEYMLFRGVRREVRSLKSELEHMYAFLETLSRMEDPDVQAKLCMAEVRELSYDIEDSIDEFNLGVDHANGGTPPASRLKGIKGFIRRVTSLFTRIRTRCRVAKEIQDLKTLVREAGERRARYKIAEGDISEVRAQDERRRRQWDTRACFLYDKSELVGMDGPKDELIALLKQGGQELRAVSIAGPGGLGKTTLANQVYSTYGQEFEHRAFVSVSRNPNVVDILRIIYTEVTIGNPNPYRQMEDSIKTVDHGVRVINRFLNDKRYFIVVDDIWDKKISEILNSAFPKNSCGSRIVITTRINEVAKCFCSYYGYHHDYKLCPLNAKDSMRLLVQRTFGHDEQCPSHLKDLCNQILTKCDGLPLAIIALSGHLASKDHTVDQWNKVLNSIGHALERDDTGVSRMFKILSLSYFDLLHHHRTCLLYLSIFPQQYAFEKQSLIKRWIAEGFISEKEGYTKYELGERCLHELIDRSLIQPVKENKFGEVKTCQVHDMILDFIVSKSLEENFVTFSVVPNQIHGQQKRVRRLALKGNKQDNDILSSELLHHCRSVTVFRDSINKLPKLLEFKILRVLHIEQCDLSKHHHSLTNIRFLFWLRYLGLKNTRLSDIPENIIELQHLETLNLKGNKITELPVSIVQLGQLIHLQIDGEVKLPDGFGQMTELQELRLLNVLKHPINFLRELSKLINMRDLSLSLESIRESDGNKYTESIMSSICKLGTLNLQSLSISIGNGCHYSFLNGSWYPAPRLRRLVIKKVPISRVPNWMGSTFINLQQLYLRMVVLRQEDVGILGGLQELVHLVLHLQTQQQEERWKQRQLYGEELKKTKEDDIFRIGLPEFIHSSGQGVENVNENKEEMPTISSDELWLNISHSHEFAHLRYQQQQQQPHQQQEEEGDDGGENIDHHNDNDDNDDDDDDEEEEEEGSRLQIPEQHGVATEASSKGQQLKFSCNHGFEKLRYLKIDGTDACKLGLKFEPGCMPRLEKLVLMFKLVGVFEVFKWDNSFGIEHLPRLTNVVCMIHCDPVRMGKDIESAMSRIVSAHPNHPKLTIKRKITNLGAISLAFISTNLGRAFARITRGTPRQ